MLKATTEESAKWYESTKEKLSAEQLTDALLDCGLFADKVPPCFNSQGLAKFAKNYFAQYIADTTNITSANEKSVKKSIEKHCSDYIRYEALRETNVPRHLGIPHPAAYALQVFAIAKHWEKIATHCNKPDPQFSRIYVRHTGKCAVFEMNYKGNERYKNEEAEISWMTGSQYIVKADIASCFPSIYTHTIPWALDGKDNAKQSNALSTSGNLLDKTTQNTRDRQTNGLLIGPHSSNVISEIILTSVDVELQKKGYQKVFRHIDDYTFYATDHDQAERFIRDLVIALRQYELTLNDKKTQILKLPRPSVENWVQRLNNFPFLSTQELRFSTVRAYLDLALECAQSIGKYSPLNYAIQLLSKRQLNERAKRLYTQEAINLALAYPYLSRLLDNYVFQPYLYDGQGSSIAKFCAALLESGLKKVYPDAIAHAIYYAMRYEIKIDLPEEKLIAVVALDDCLTNVLLYRYAKRENLQELQKGLKTHAQNLKQKSLRDIQKNWLLVYELWEDNDLKGKSQEFLLELRKTGMQFIRFPQDEFVNVAL